MLDRQWRYFLFGVIFLISLLPVTGHALSDREVYDLLSNQSEEIKKFPFNVYISRSEDHPNYGVFEGRELPVPSYAFFARIPHYNLKDRKEAGEIYATFKFSQSDQWKCFLLRVPGMYAIEQIDLWVFDTKNNMWLEPLMIAESWGDAGEAIDVQGWIVGLSKDGQFHVVRRKMEIDLHIYDRTPHATRKITKSEVFIWDKDHFKDASKEYSNKLDFKKYQFKKNKINNIE
jgi:hypothetical protein